MGESQPRKNRVLRALSFRRTTQNQRVVYIEAALNALGIGFLGRPQVFCPHGVAVVAAPAGFPDA